MDSAINLDAINIHWVGSIPLANVRSNFDETFPPGEWIALSSALALFNTTANQLRGLVGESFHGIPIVLINRQNLVEICLAEVPPPQKTFPLNPAGAQLSHESDLSSTRPQAAEAADIQRDAIQVGEVLLLQNEQGRSITAESFIHEVRKSPDPALTGSALHLAGSGEMVHGQHISFNPGIHQQFPKCLESEEEFHLRFADFGEVGSGIVMANFRRLHQPGKIADTDLGLLLRYRKRLPISLSGSPDQFLFRLGATAGIELDAIVTMTLSTRDQAIDRFTLKKLLNPAAVASQLREMVESFQQLSL